MAKIYFYEDKHYLFSNFSAHAVVYKEDLYPTSEHAYQAAKFTRPDIKKKIRNARSPLEAKRLANSIYRENRISNWDEIKVETMYQIVKEKVNQHTEVKGVLVATGNSEIIEDSPVDYFWGCGKDKSGQNQMGKILMRIRDEITRKHTL